ncbi:helix-turn-helix domain-containing protein [Bifidobacterium aquikefiri]|uniref:helix-turn-helix domain-containing protein n=1 Tax=Bifidobacterium aquikefiri TaxID=1653207 RepID=UPI0039ED32B0
MASISGIHHMATVVRDARLARGWTQEELAAQSGFSRVWINRFELTAIAEPSFSRILTLCNILGIKLTVSYAIDPDAVGSRETSQGRAKEGAARSGEGNMGESIGDKMTDDMPPTRQRRSRNAATILETLALRSKEQRSGGIGEEESA